MLEDFASEADGIADVLQGGDRTWAEGGPIHDDGVAFDAAIEIEMRAEAGVEDGIVFKDDDSGFDGVESGTAAGEDGPSGGECAGAAGFAGVNGVVGNVPRAAVDDERRFHGKGGWQRGS